MVQRVIHATADFDFAKTLHFTPDAAQRGVEYLRRGGVIVTDTHMACSGVSRAALERLDGWTTEGIHDALIALAEKLAVKNATLMWPVRIAAAGKAVTPGGAVEICHILGREETVRRLKVGLEKLSQ